MEKEEEGQESRSLEVRCKLVALKKESCRKHINHKYEPAQVRLIDLLRES